MCQQVWGGRHIDDAVLRRENRDFTNDTAGATYESTWYYATDALFGVVGALDGATGATVERVRYTPYGVARHSRLADIDGDGAVNGTDLTILFNDFGATPAAERVGLRRLSGTLFIATGSRPRRPIEAKISSFGVSAINCCSYAHTHHDPI